MNTMFVNNPKIIEERDCVFKNKTTFFDIFDINTKTFNCKFIKIGKKEEDIYYKYDKYPYLDHRSRAKSNKYNCYFYFNQPYRNIQQLEDYNFEQYIPKRLNLKSIILDYGYSFHSMCTTLQIFAPANVIDSIEFQKDIEKYRDARFQSYLKSFKYHNYHGYVNPFDVISKLVNDCTNN